MIKKLNANKIIILLLVAICAIFILNPKVYIASCLNGISVWAFSVLPTLFPFFILTRLIVSLKSTSTNRLDKFFCKVYRSPSGSLFTFLLSAISGYPMGAKLICANHEYGICNKHEAQKMLSYCSISGPMFMVGTVGVAILNSHLAGLCVAIANVLGALMNGLIFRGKKTEFKPQTMPIKTINSNLLSDTVYEALHSVLMVGGFIVLSFLLIDILKNFNIFSTVASTICWVFKSPQAKDVVTSIMNGGIEITRGILDLSATNLPLNLKTIITSGLVGFGGVSILLQSLTFLKKLHLPIKTVVLQKLTQGILSALFAIPLTLIFM